MQSGSTRGWKRGLGVSGFATMDSLTKASGENSECKIHNNWDLGGN